jgi:hypothetical protein
MNSGKRERVVISCVTFETSKITDPILFYDATRVHLIHYTDTSHERNVIYSEFYQQVCKIIRKNLPKTEIVEHETTVYDFTTMLKTVLKILREEEKADVFVNISAGTSEYTAAAVIASMMHPESVPFSVSTKEYSIPEEELRKIYYSGGVPVGLTRVTRDPKALPHYRIDMPEEHLVSGLRVFERKNRDGHISGTIVIDALKESDVWYRVERSADNDAERKKHEAVLYQRDFVDKWKNNGWIEKDRKTKKYCITDTGKIVLNTFYTENKE